MKAKKQPPTTPQQRTLDSFLTKRKGSGTKENDEEEENESKRPKTISTNSDKQESEEVQLKSKTPLTPDQKNLIMAKQAAARLKLVAHRLPLIDPDSVGASWFNELLHQEFNKPYFKQLSDFYTAAAQRATVYPPRDQIFSWTRHCEIRDVRVVILGQDPYHGPRQAHGLCFSVQKGVHPPPSLVNMYKELLEDPEVPEFTSIPSHGCLVGWAQQGVLLLNAVLTVEASKANSHKDKGWENLTSAVIKWISNNLRDVVFLLWGAHAQKMGSVVDKTRHCVLTTVHPSPLSAHRGFFGCRHFSKCNQELEKRGRGLVRWHELP